MSNNIIVTTEKMVNSGQALARLDGREILVFNALPNETVEVEITKRKKDYWEGIAVNILKSSTQRVLPKEKHFLSCSPWQIVSSRDENEFKKSIAKEIYQNIGNITVNDIQILSDDSHDYGYRNKMEYSFAKDANDDSLVSLAFFHRGKKIKYPIDCCLLAQPMLNNVAKKVVVWINEHKIPIRTLKSLILRSNRKDEILVALFIKDEIQIPSVDIKQVHANLVGFQIYLSNFRSPASVADKLLFTQGKQEIEENTCSSRFLFGALSFFQVNTALFEKAIQFVESQIDQGCSLVDYYGGVGSISIPLSKKVVDCCIIDSNAEAIACAKKNIENNGLSHFTAICSPAEKLLDYILSDKIIIFDPPREGLHPHVTRKVLDVLPKKILYLSCNLSTHARDLALLSKKYTLHDFVLFNFFPHTPHIEALCVLERK